jgi:hypothetical protein
MEKMDVKDRLRSILCLTKFSNEFQLLFKKKVA